MQLLQHAGDPRRILPRGHNGSRKFPRTELLQLKIAAPLFDEVPRKWQLRVPDSFSSLPLINDYFPTAKISGDAITYCGSSFERDVLRHLLDTNRLELPASP